MKDSNAQVRLKCSEIAIQYVILTTARSRPTVRDLPPSERLCMCQDGHPCRATLIMSPCGDIRNVP